VPNAVNFSLTLTLDAMLAGFQYQIQAAVTLARFEKTEIQYIPN